MLSKAGGTLLLAFAVSILALLVIGIVTYRAVQTLISQNERVVHTQEVLVGLQEVKTGLVQAESDGRGFLLTGDEAFYKVYVDQLAEIQKRIAALKEKVSDNPGQAKRFVLVEKALASRFEILDSYITKRRSLGDAPVASESDRIESRRRIDELQDALDAISREEQTLLQTRAVTATKSGGQLTYTLILAVASLAVLIGLVFYLAYRDIQTRRFNEERLQTARDELENRVRERTEELTVLNTELERSNRELQDFAFVASHDLQEPLRKIQAFGDRLLTVQGPKFDDQGRDYLNRMHSAAERMHTLINDLLAYSRVTTKARPFQPTDLSNVVLEVLSDLETSIEQSDGTVEAAELPTIDADALQMRQLFQNLIANALKFRKPDVSPEVRVESEILQGEQTSNGRAISETLVRITVSDNGIGFDEKYLDRIFTPFQRLHGRNEYDGTGIGLAVCRKIVERHGGTLTARSTVGEGSTFIATLPMTQPKEK